MNRPGADAMDYAGARRILGRQLNQAVADQLKILLETKHLYQSVSVNFTAIAAPISKGIVLHNHKTLFERLTRELNEAPLMPSEKLLVSADEAHYLPTLLLQNVKLYCPSCKQRASSVKSSARLRTWTRQP